MLYKHLAFLYAGRWRAFDASSIQPGPGRRESAGPRRLRGAPEQTNQAQASAGHLPQERWAARPVPLLDRCGLEHRVRHARGSLRAARSDARVFCRGDPARAGVDSKRAGELSRGCRMSNTQLFLAIAVPLAFNAIGFLLLRASITDLRDSTRASITDL